MRLSIPIIVIFFFHSLVVVGQKTNKYKFIYKFHLEEPNDSCKISIDTLQNQGDINTVRGELTNNKSNPIGFLTIILKNNDTTISAITNQKGLFELKAKPSTYDLTIAGVGYKTLNQLLSIDRQNNFTFRITLAIQASLDWYNIYSKKELTPDEIDKIKKCVQDNNEKIDKCGRKNEYSVTMEI